ncbi:ubiquitin-conjugating enzyme 1, E2-like protein [Chondrus crispus]|uniref:Ubiquitin-conjugating enzyme 1, E2-like protein n=1 Tax=Chondrus crispus TaxID=2769 RepID=R7QHB2_CHOCR|nr:ubiquitin-conjugating enzyme 1, E2-like protein [Chondrus crispus]CDF36856.1 ubiquitin-conjugating enzyme 1, E2-like protein [Chondrus crispus]|eukprot:XP_005716675.1 ubiquitin-conjugating enzyme 1, E2-like protein [Chondrus crispus]
MMSASSKSAAALRLMTDLKMIRKEPPEGCSAGPILDDNIFAWEATILGPADTPWEDGIYNMYLTFPERYPEEGPTARFQTEMFHPNIQENGKVCLDIIQENWSPVYTVNMILMSIQSLLADPNPNSAANSEAAQIYHRDRNAYEKKVRECAAKSINL